MKKPLLFFTGMLCIIMAYADIPSGYYDNAEGLSEQALRSALHNIIDDHTVKSYGDARYILDETDQDPGNSSNIILVYTGNSVSGSWDSGETWNREHVWSKSHGFPDESDIAYSDLHNLKPCHPDVNTDRGDKDFEVGGSTHGIATLCNYTSTTWEPRDEVKGDIARIMLYMVVRYEGDVSGEADLELVNELTSYPDPEFGIFSTLLQWHYDDPVDDFERNRNDVIYSHQNNRNPFIDHPEYVSKIWGGGSTNPAPTISNISHSPDIPADSEGVEITANITDDYSVVSAEIRWGIISGALLDTINMNNTTGNAYITISEIPSQTNGTIIYYEVAATDDSSGTSISSEYSYTVNNSPPNIILNEDFSSCPASGWTTYSVSGSEDWECSDNGYLYINAYDGNGASDDWYVSPPVNFDLYSEEYLTFRSWTKYTDTSYPTIELMYSTDYSGSGDPTEATWSNLSATWSDEDSQTWTSSDEIDLSFISGANVYIAFRYTSTGTISGECAIWEIDDIYLSEKPNSLPEISQVSHSPVNPTESQNITIQGTITDTDGTISSANIKWGTTSGAYPNTVAMSNSGDDYTGTISAQTGGTFIYYVIEATDNDTDTRRSLEQVLSVNSSGNNAPVITNIITDPDSPNSSIDVNISATITDPDGSISAAQLLWGTAPGDYAYTMNMSSVENTYSGFIPARDEDTHIYFVIKTMDNDGGLTLSSENDYLINNPPVISNISISPDNPTDSDEVTISTAISDENGSINSAVLKWKTKGTISYNDVTMSLSGSNYEATIPQQESGDTIIFYVTAADSYGSSTESAEYNYFVNNPPTITNVTISPQNPTNDDNVTVLADISDDNSNVETVTLNWKKNDGGSYATITMTLSGANYEATIPKQTAGDSIVFTITAEDSYFSESIYYSGYKVSSATTITDILDKNLLIYPNPVINELFIKLENYTGHIEVQVLNLEGKMVYSKKFYINSEYKLKLNDIKQGIYLFRLRYDDDNYITRKILIN